MPLELNEVPEKKPRETKFFDARNLRKSFQAACVKVGLEVKTGPGIGSIRGCSFMTFAAAASGISSDPEFHGESYEDFGAFNGICVRKV